MKEIVLSICTSFDLPHWRSSHRIVRLQNSVLVTASLNTFFLSYYVRRNKRVNFKWLHVRLWRIVCWVRSSFVATVQNIATGKFHSIVLKRGEIIFNLSSKELTCTSPPILCWSVYGVLKVCSAFPVTGSWIILYLIFSLIL